MGELYWALRGGGKVVVGKLTWHVCSLQKFLLAADRSSTTGNLWLLSRGMSAGASSQCLIISLENRRDSKRSPACILLTYVGLCQSHPRKRVVGFLSKDDISSSIGGLFLCLITFIRALSLFEKEP